jgi:hypothetical protein
MKAIKYFTIIVLLAGSISACTGDRTKATIGGTQDTSSVAGAKDSAGAVGAAPKPADSTGKGNANPTGRLETDTLKPAP